MRIQYLAAVLSIAGFTSIAPGAERADRPAAPPARQNAAPPLPENVNVQRDLPYIAGADKSQSLDLYLPGKSETALPLVIWIHGGGWSAGDKANCPAIMLVTRGYAVASVNYRLSQQAIFPAQIQDCQAAIRWLRANCKTYNIDPNHVGVWGGSAGGHLVALLGTAGGKNAFPIIGGNETMSDRVQAVCDWFGPTDFSTMDAQAIPTGNKQHSTPTSPESRLLGGAVPQNLDKALYASPLHYVSKDNPPFLIMHGTMDPAVPPAQSDTIAADLKKAGVDVVLQKLKGAGHGGPAFNKPAVRDMVTAFFDKNLKGMNVKVEALPE